MQAILSLLVTIPLRLMPLLQLLLRQPPHPSPLQLWEHKPVLLLSQKISPALHRTPPTISERMLQILPEHDMVLFYQRPLWLLLSLLLPLLPLPPSLPLPPLSMAP